ncbi:hypothetical protein AOQ84DRAFT_361994 [Glonium stellatum]|uniref:Uncharacterized protein n=1 Tax=Glonium stellatum TaxID=574774 RepID=A0A8E2F5F5_9PEZI|nr:hypothetical protein AOQ84DRAFT_361994 [Glonium stellatum]
MNMALFEVTWQLIEVTEPINLALSVCWLGLAQAAFEYAGDGANAAWIRSLGLELVPSPDIYDSAQRAGRGHIEKTRVEYGLQHQAAEWREEALRAFARAWARLSKAERATEADEVNQKGVEAFGHSAWSEETANLVSSEEMEDYAGEGIMF